MPAPSSWRRLVALVLAPTLVAGGALLATWNPGERFDGVEAAIVNDDEMVVIDDKPVPLGRQLAAELTGSDHENNVRWVLADAKTARSGLESGRYAAVVTIPSNFSATATSMMGVPAGAQRATIAVETSARAGVSEMSLGRTLADASVTALNQDLARVYLDNVFLGFSSMHEQLGKAADGAHEIATGQDALGEGLTQATEGASALADGVGQLVDSNPELVEGGAQLATGSGRLSAGMAQLDDAVRGLPASTGLLSSGARDLAQAVNTVAEAGESLAEGSVAIESGGSQLASGASELDAGVQHFTAGTTTYITHANDLIRSAADAGSTLAPLIEQVDALVTGLASGTRELSSLSEPVFEGAASTLGMGETLATSSTRLAEQVTTARRSVAALSAGEAEVPCPDALRGTAGACDAFAQGVRAGSTAAGQPLAEVDLESTVQLARGFTPASESVTAALARVDGGIAKLAEQASAAQDQWVAASDQVRLPDPSADASDLERLLGAGDDLLAAAPALAEGSSRLAQGAGSLVDGAGELARGAGALSDGLDRVADGARAVADGTHQLSSAAPALATGLDEAARGSAEVATGVSHYTQGIIAYTDGVSQVGAGVDDLASGLGEARSGAEELTDGSSELADALGDAADEVPNYSAEERDNLTAVVAAPIDLVGRDVDRGAPGITALVVIAALWFGTLAAARNVPRHAVVSADGATGRLLVRIVGPTLGVGAVLGAVLGLFGGLHLGLHPERVAGLTGLAVVTGCAFAAVNHALVLWWGPWGRLASALLWALPSTMLLTRTASAYVGPLAPVSPASPGLDVVAAWATGQAILGTTLALAAWCLAGLSLAAVWVHRGRTTTLRAVARRAA